MAAIPRLAIQKGDEEMTRTMRYWQHSMEAIVEPDDECDCTTCTDLRERNRGSWVRRIEIEDRIADEMLAEMRDESGGFDSL